MNPIVSEFEWSESSLLCKTRLYLEQMDSSAGDNWKFGLWSALALEFLVRAVLAHISPVLLVADTGKWQNLAAALGKKAISFRSKPKSATTTEIVGRLADLVPEFTPELQKFCRRHIEKRNIELHSGVVAFEDYPSSEWMSEFYSCCDILLKSMDKEIEDIMSNPTEIREIIDSRNKDIERDIEGLISDYKNKWLQKDLSERDSAKEAATLWATRDSGHGKSCPSCGSPALLKGTPSKPAEFRIEGDSIIKKQRMSPASFECIACGLKIIGRTSLLACRMGDAFGATSTYTASQFFGLYSEEDVEEIERQIYTEQLEDARHEMDYNE